MTSSKKTPKPITEGRHQSTPPTQLRWGFQLWLDSLEAKGCTPMTCTTYRDIVGPFVTYLEEQQLGIDSTQSAHIRAWLIKRRRDGLSSRSVQDMYVKPRTMWRFFLREGLTENDPFASVEPPKVEQKIKPDLTPEQVQSLFEACNGRDWLRKRDCALLALLLDTGLRCHEAASLKIAHAQLTQFALKGKGGKERFVFFSQPLRLTLHKYLKSLPYETEESDPLFWGTKGPLSLSGIKEVIENTGERAGITPLGPHRLRRTFATWSLRSGCDIESLRRLMGHSTLTVLRQYLNLVESDLKRAHQEHSPLMQCRSYGVTNWQYKRKRKK